MVAVKWFVAILGTATLVLFASVGVVGLYEHERPFMERDRREAEARAEAKREYDRIEGFGQLHTLCLTDTRVAGPGLKSLTRLANLKDLGLRGTPIDDDGIQIVAGLFGLEYLDLEKTAITDAGLLHLTRLKWLKGLYVAQTQVTPEGIARLKEALPKLNILPPSGTGAISSESAAEMEARSCRSSSESSYPSPRRCSC
ncbi:MAG TPA: hypothetical protein VGX78_23100, partial [Pirellulales bacterium]|nr:hypothetical protein [Pirellulales bacterium]